MCCEPSGYLPQDINGVCPVCQEQTCDGDAYEKCGYSPTHCLECGYAPCDGSC